MSIRRMTVYETMGQRFDTAAQARQFREDQVERFMRECPGFQDVPLKRRIEFVQHLLDNRAKLRVLLDYPDLPEDDE